LIVAAEEMGFLELVSRIFPENEFSRAHHRACGFREVGLYRRQGKFDGAWCDCVIVERLLATPASRSSKEPGDGALLA